MKIFKKFLFYLFTLIYIFFCPLIILYALGITINPKTEKIIKTGIIYLSSTPQGAAVYLNDKPFPRKTPTVIRELSAGQYTIKLTYDGYKPFEKTLTVHEEKAAALDQILLIPNQWNKAELTTFAVDQLIPVGETPFFLIQQGPLIKDLFIVHSNQGISQALHSETGMAAKAPEAISLFKSESIYLEANVKEIFTIKNSPFLLLKVSMNKQEYFLWLSPLDQSSEPLNITDLIVRKPNQVRWQADDENNLYSLSSGIVDQINVSKKAIFPKIAENVRSYTIFNKEIYALTNENIIEKLDNQGEVQNKNTSNPSIVKSFFTKQGPIEFYVFQDNVFLFLGSQGELFSNRSPYEIVSSNVEDIVTADNDQKRFLLWTKNKIGILIFSLQKNDTDIFNQDASVKWITESGTSIQQAFEVSEGSHVVYLDNNTIFLLETETFGDRVQAIVARVKDGTNIHYSDDEGKLYYIDPKTSLLMSIEIIAPNPILPLSFYDDMDNQQEQPTP